MQQRALCLFLALAISALSVGCPEENTDPIDPSIDYRQEMRDFVQEISAYAKDADSSFLVVPQNGEALLTEDGTPTGAPSIAYVNSIDGLGREDLFYGYVSDDCATPAEDRDAMLAMLDLAEAAGKEVLVIDYCSTCCRVDTSYSWNASHGFASIATVRALDAFPAYPSQPYAVSSTDVTSLGAAKNLLYLLDPGTFGSAMSYGWALDSTNYDVLVIEPYFGNQLLSPEQVEALKTKANGGKRLILAYMSIGEAEDYRYYWQANWNTNAPSWLLDENPEWQGNYKVRYWEPEWQSLIFGDSSAYLDRLMAAGFDGVYLDLIDAYEYFEE